MEPPTTVRRCTSSAKRCCTLVHISCHGRPCTYSTPMDRLSVAVAESWRLTRWRRRVSPHAGQGSPAKRSVMSAPQPLHSILWSDTSVLIYACAPYTVLSIRPARVVHHERLLSKPIRPQVGLASVHLRSHYCIGYSARYYTNLFVLFSAATSRTDFMSCSRVK